MAGTTANASSERALTDEKILIPHREVTLLNGERVTVAPWGLTQGALVLARLDGLTPKLGAGDLNARQILAKAWDEVVDLVSLSVNVDRAEMELPPTEGGWTFEDVLSVTEAVLEVCIIRSDGRGALPLLVGLMTRMTEAVSRGTAPRLATPQSNGSAPEGTSQEQSRNGSGSRKRATRKRGRSSRSS